MRNVYRPFKRKKTGYYYAENIITHKQQSLKTNIRSEALRLIAGLNESNLNPILNKQLARAYLSACDPKISIITWQEVFEHIIKNKSDLSQARWEIAIKDKNITSLLRKKLVETTPVDLLNCLLHGGVSTNNFLKTAHRVACDMGWLLGPIIPRGKWPPIKYKSKRAITEEEHKRIVQSESNAQRKIYYQLLWHLGASQHDMAQMKAENIDLEQKAVSFCRKKTGTSVFFHFGEQSLALFKLLPQEGFLFPDLARVNAGNRATQFQKRCKNLKIKGITLHSYRYAWAERASTSGMPIRHAMQALGHKSTAVHLGYAKQAVVAIPSLEDLEKDKIKNIVPFINPQQDTDRSWRK